ncbi:Na+:solute symporter, partial [Streptomyces sp. NPDC005799]
LGLLRPFRRSGPTAALTSWSMGLLAFWLVNYPINWNVKGGVPLQYQVSVPLAVSLLLYILIGYLKPEDTPDRLAVIERINTDDDSTAAAVPVPAGGVDDTLGKTPVKD